jgi:pseudaminic acid synthase
MKQIKLDNTFVGDNCPPYVVAELSGNHNGSINRAKDIITAAKNAGAHAIKIQTFKPDSITLPSNKDEFMIKRGLWAGNNLYELYQKTCLPYEWHEALFTHAKAIGITMFSTPFAEQDVEFLESFDVPAYKIASNELTHLPLIKAVIDTKKPIILSTGTATEEEVQTTIKFLEDNGCQDYIILYCVSSYPAPLEDCNLATLTALKATFGSLVGLSDHSMGIIAPIVATTLGACFIEKHFTLDRKDGGSDSSFSIEPHDLKILCDSVLAAYQSIGKAQFGYKACEKLSPIFKRHYYSTREIAAGETLSLANIAAVRSPKGVSSRDFNKVIGCKVNKSIAKHEAIQWEDIY